MIAHAVLGCDPVLTRLFTPAHPRLGRYEVCTTRDPIERMVSASGPGTPHYSPIELLLAVEALGTVGPYDKSAVSRLYGGSRPKVARGWLQEGDRFESVTLISPYPDASLSRLEAGTMVIRLTIDNADRR